MAIDPDSQTLTQWLLALMGVGGGGYKLVTHETRIARLEEDRKGDIEKIDKSTAEIAEMKGTLDSTASMVQSIHDHLLGRGR